MCCAFIRPRLDYEANPYGFNLTVQVEDMAGLNATAFIRVFLNDKNDPPVFTNCPAESSMPIEWEFFFGHSSIQGLIFTPDQVDNINTYDLGGSLQVGDDWRMCQQLCRAHPECKAFTLFARSYRISAWRGGCYGRSAFQSTMVRVETGQRNTRTDDLGTYTVVSGNKVPVCQNLTVLENTPLPLDIGAPVTVVDFEGDTFTVAILPDGNKNIRPDLPGGTFATAWAISQAGQLSLNAAVLDQENRNRFLLIIEAEDSAGAKARVTVAIHVLNVRIMLHHIWRIPCFHAPVAVHCLFCTVNAAKGPSCIGQLDSFQRLFSSVVAGQ